MPQRHGSRWWRVAPSLLASFASSLQTMFCYEGKAESIRPDMPTRPKNLCGVSKVIAEQQALDEAAVAVRHLLATGIESIALQ